MHLSSNAQESGLFDNYVPLPKAYDEYFSPERQKREVSAKVAEALEQLGTRQLVARQALATKVFMSAGITFSVYSDSRGQERVFPFDVMPRVVDAVTWGRIERGLQQRVAALDAFLHDVYGEQKSLRDNIVPPELVLTSEEYVPAMRGIVPPGGRYIHVAGIDPIRDEQGQFVVLEDNVRTPSGVSYVLENRNIMKRLIPRIFEETKVQNVDQYPSQLRRALEQCAPVDSTEPTVVLLTPGPFNSAYFEHTYLARRMGIPLVQGRDLFVHNDKVYVKTIGGPRRVHVIYRRTDDSFLDPECFNAESMLGVPGLVRSYCTGNVTLANGIGNGIADDKSIYPFVPAMIRYFLAEEPILGQVETYICAREPERNKVLAELPKMVVKAVNGSGGYGMLIGYSASQSQLAEFDSKLRSNPKNYIAQPVVDFSTCPTFADGALGPRRVDLRPFIVSGNSSWVLPGGLTRVALQEGSYVVNSSQGGGSKDTWILRP